MPSKRTSNTHAELENVKRQGEGRLQSSGEMKILPFKPVIEWMKNTGGSIEFGKKNIAKKILRMWSRIGILSKKVREKIDLKVSPSYPVNQNL